jgi:hypothetical protein
MRIFLWTGPAALAAAGAAGYLSCELVHRCAAGGGAPSPDAVEVAEASEAPPADAPRLEPAEVIDLACAPNGVHVSQFAQTTEPPLAAPAPWSGVLRTVSFEVPAGLPDGPEPAPATLPYLTDDADEPPAKPPSLGDIPPAKLPPLSDVPPALPPSALPGDPLFDAVQKFFQDAGNLPAIDKAPLGKPPVGERPPIAEGGATEGGRAPAPPQGRPISPGAGEAGEMPPARVPQQLPPVSYGPELSRQKVDTMEVRPGEAKPPKASDLY